MQAPYLSFKKIDFGYANAHTEAREKPELLLDGYIDYMEVSAKVETSKEWLILGYKGSGKTAVAERIKLKNLNNPHAFINLLNLEDFQYLKFLKIVKEQEAPEIVLPTAWSWLIYTFMLNSFFCDNSVHNISTDDFEDIRNAFKKMGLSPIKDIESLIKVSSENSFQLAIPRFADKKWTKKTESREVDIRWYLYNLRSFISKIRSNSKHLIIIDGLDDVLASTHLQVETISALIFEANRINHFLRENLVPAKIVVLCRTDIYEILGGANKNKIRQDYSIDLDWNSNPKSPNNSLLIKIANLRCENSLRQKVDIFSYFMPERFLWHFKTKKYLLDMTRHTPRDFLQLMKYIQLSCKGDKVARDELKDGLREYSNKYFLPEIYDELNGYANMTEIKGIISAISHLRKRDFSYKELQDACSEIDWCPDHSNLLKILHALYECSAIGNLRFTDEKRGYMFLSFKYRNRHSSFKKQEKIVLHRGLWRAFNLPTSNLEGSIDPDIETSFPKQY